MKTKPNLLTATTFLVAATAGFGQPLITNQPQPQAVAPGEAATFTVGASGTHPLTYQWQRNLGTGFANLPDATNAALVLTNAESWDAWDYRVVVSNSGGTTNNAGAHLYVIRFAPLSTNLFADNFDDNRLTGWNLLLPSSGAGGRLSETNGQFTVYCSWPGKRTDYYWNTLQEGYLSKNWSLREGQTVEFRADLVAISENTTNATLFEVVQDWDHTYTFAKGRDWIRMGKYASLNSIAFWCERASLRNTNVVLAFALTKATPNVILTGRVLDKANPSVVLYQPSFVEGRRLGLLVLLLVGGQGLRHLAVVPVDRDGLETEPP